MLKTSKDGSWKDYSEQCVVSYSTNPDSIPTFHRVPKVCQKNPEQRAMKIPPQKYGPKTKTKS